MTSTFSLLKHHRHIKGFQRLAEKVKSPFFCINIQTIEKKYSWNQVSQVLTILSLRRFRKTIFNETIFSYCTRCGLVTSMKETPLKDLVFSRPFFFSFFCGSRVKGGLKHGYQLHIADYVVKDRIHRKTFRTCFFLFRVCRYYVVKSDEWIVLSSLWIWWWW